MNDSNIFHNCRAILWKLLNPTSAMTINHQVIVEGLKTKILMLTRQFKDNDLTTGLFPFLPYI